MKSAPRSTRAIAVAIMAAALGGACDATPSATSLATATTVPRGITSVASTTTAGSDGSVGSLDNPIEVLFVTYAPAETIKLRGEVMVEALEKATGLHLDLVVADSYASTIQRMCENPDRTMGIVSGIGYVLASDLCGVDVAFKAVRFGYDSYWTEFLVRRDSTITSLTDLGGLSWAYPDPGSTVGYMLPLLALKNAGVEPGPMIETGDPLSPVMTVYRGDADFGTSFFIPPILPDRTWQSGDEPDVPEELATDCRLTLQGHLTCGGYEVRDARAPTALDAPDIMGSVRILAISEGVPNDTISFGPNFPPNIRKQVETALIEFAASAAWETSIGSNDFYGWSGLSPAVDDEYDVVREIVALVGLGVDNL